MNLTLPKVLLSISDSSVLGYNLYLNALFLFSVIFLTLAFYVFHEIAHFAFQWPSDIDEQQEEKLATAIAGAFLFPKADAIRELGIHRRSITTDMLIVCKEYGISMSLLVVRAHLCGIINDAVYEAYFRRAGRNEGSYLAIIELPTLFEQLVYRAVNEDEITIQKGAELLKMPYDLVAANCCFAEV